jgi:acetyltransferase-like isoleucine patch superfamily enzyme
MTLISDLVKNPITYWLRWVINKNLFLYKNKQKNVQIDYLSHVTNSKMANNTTIYQNVRLHNVSIDSYSYIANHTVVIGATIGKFCCIGPNCRIGLGVHPTSSYVSAHPIFYSRQSHVGVTFADRNYVDEFKDIYIGNDVWIGANVLIKDGVKIGDGAIIGAGAIVTKDVASYAIVAGNPAKLIRYRFSEEQIQNLLRMQWWNKDINEIRDNFKKYHDIKNLMS